MTWNDNGGNRFTQEQVDVMFARKYAGGASANADRIAVFDRALEFFKNAGLVQVIA